jgi:hypothetical protein
MNTTKKYATSIVLGLFLLSVVADLAAAQTPQGPETEDVTGDQAQRRMQAGEEIQLRFRSKTQVRVKTNVSMDVDMAVDAEGIGDRDFAVEINATDDIELTMNCSEEQAQLGLQNGSTHRTRNRNRYQYKSQFAVQLQANGTVQARLAISLNAGEEGAVWAYFDEETEEWVESESEVVDGELVTDTTHFSVWTILVPEDDGTTIDGPSILGIATITGVLALVLARKRR